MIVYHGSVSIVEQPDVLHSYRPLDFGKGFYVTSVKAQAERWARRKADLTGRGAPIVNVYRMSEDYAGLSVKSFGGGPAGLDRLRLPVPQRRGYLPGI